MYIQDAFLDESQICFEFLFNYWTLFFISLQNCVQLDG